LEGFYPIWVVLEALTRDTGVECIVWSIILLPFAGYIDSFAFAKINPNVVAIGKRLPDRAIDV